MKDYRERKGEAGVEDDSDGPLAAGRALLGPAAQNPHPPQQSKGREAHVSFKR